MVKQGVKRKLSAVLSADVKGYSRLMDDDEVTTVHTLKSYRQVIATLVDSLGDNVLAEPESLVDRGPIEPKRDIYDAIAIGSYS